MSNERSLNLTIKDYGEQHADVVVRLKVLLRLIRAQNEAVGAAIGDATKPLLARIGELEREVKELRERPSIQYLGPFEQGKSYRPFDAITSHGSVWICTSPTSEKPSFSAPTGWRLAVKKGADGRDARPGSKAA
jgi:hypothetical protein